MAGTQTALPNCPAPTSCICSALWLPQIQPLHLSMPSFTARLDCCSSLNAGLPVGQLRCLDRVLRSAALLSRCIPKCGHVSSYMMDVIHWISYCIIYLVRRSLLGLAPAYLQDLCGTTTGFSGSSLSPLY